MSKRGTRRSDLQRKPPQRKKPAPIWVQRWGWLGALGVCLLILSGVTYWLFASGWISQQIGRTERAFLAQSTKVGLSIEDVYIMGRNETRQHDILSALAVRRGQPMLVFDPYLAREELESLPWIRSARVERRFPSTILISLAEREPVGILQHGGKQSLVDETGTVLTREELQRWRHLPVLVGNGAPQAAPKLIRALLDFPDLYWRVRAMTYVYQRRWDLLLDNSVTIRLPEENIGTALARLNRAEKEGEVLNGSVLTIDLRLPDRIIMEPVPGITPRTGI